MARTRPCNGGVHVCVRVHGRERAVYTAAYGQCTRLVRSVLLRFSLQNTPFMPKCTATNPLHSKRARTTSAPSAAMRTTVLRTMLIIGWMESWATCLCSTNYGTKLILTYMWWKQSQMRTNTYPLCVKNNLVCHYFHRFAYIDAKIVVIQQF